MAKAKVVAVKKESGKGKMPPWMKGEEKMEEKKPAPKKGK